MPLGISIITARALSKIIRKQSNGTVLPPSRGIPWPRQSLDLATTMAMA